MTTKADRRWAHVYRSVYRSTGCAADAARAANNAVRGLTEASPQDVLAVYDQKITRAIERGLKTSAADIRRIRKTFKQFQGEILSSAGHWRLNRATAAQVLRDTAKRIDGLVSDLGVQIRDGVSAVQGVNADILQTYGDLFAPGDSGALHLVGLEPQAIDLIGEFSADLIDLNRGGLGREMLSAVNRQIRLAALAGAGGAFNAQAAINAALGGERKWTFRAERIYRTEVLRTQSMLMQQSIVRLNHTFRTKKQWVWSGISRPEHKSINGQIVSATGTFSVPTKDGGTAKLRFPRDPIGPPSATINCGCWLVPVPSKIRQGAARKRAVPRGTTRKPKAAAAKVLSPVEQYNQRVTGWQERFARDSVMRSHAKVKGGLELGFRARNRAMSMIEEELVHKHPWAKNGLVRALDETFIRQWSSSSTNYTSTSLKWALRKAWGESPQKFYFGPEIGLKTGSQIPEGLKRLSGLVRDRLGLRNTATNEQFWAFMDDYVAARGGYTKWYLSESRLANRTLYRGHNFRGAMASEYVPQLAAGKGKMYVPNGVSSWTEKRGVAEGFGGGGNGAVFKVNARADQIFGTWRENGGSWHFGATESEFMLNGSSMVDVVKGSTLNLTSEVFNVQTQAAYRKAVIRVPSDRSKALLDAIRVNEKEVYEAMIELQKQGWTIKLERQTLDRLT